jgi:hypothetical protein
MKSATPTCVSILLVGATALLVDEAALQNRYSKHTEEPKDNSTDTEAQVDNWVQYAMPGQHHRLLEKMAGQWNMTVRYRMNSQAPVVESVGTCERTWILGKRFLLEEFDGGSLGLPFKGLAIYGYDGFVKKYTCVWLDTMSTAITSNLGTCVDGCAQINFVGRHGDPWTGTMRPSRGVTRFVDANRHVLELHEPDGSGKEFKILEIVYTRE